jgi:biopolymer transport protein ExbD
MNFRKKYKPELPAFQIAPMVDVVFLMLCFFLTSQFYSVWETEIGVQLPTSSSKDIPQRLPGEIIVNILRDGTVIVNRQVLDDAGLRKLLGRLVSAFQGQPIIIRAHKKVAYEHVIRVLDTCRQADIWNISFATTSTEEAPEK